MRRKAGVRLGRPPAIPEQLARRIADQRAAGASLREIARCLDQEGVPTPHGGAQWRPSSLERVLQRPGLASADDL